MDDKKDLNRGCAVEKKRVTNKEPSGNRKPTNKPHGTQYTPKLETLLPTLLNI